MFRLSYLYVIKAKRLFYEYMYFIQIYLPLIEQVNFLIFRVRTIQTQPTNQRIFWALKSILQRFWGIDSWTSRGLTGSPRGHHCIVFLICMPQKYTFYFMSRNILWYWLSKWSFFTWSCWLQPNEIMLPKD